MSIRLRLTVWYVALLAGILVLMSAGLYGFLYLTLLQETDLTLQTRATEIQNSVRTILELQRDPIIYYSRGGVTLLPSADSFATPGVYVELALLDGSPVNRSDNLGTRELAVPATILERVSHGESLFANLTVDNVPLRVYVAPLEFPRRGVGTETVGVIEVAHSLQDVNQTLRWLAMLLGIGIVAGLGIASVVGAIIARSALAPIDRITQTAQSITRAGDLTRRIERKATRDEVGHLASTFNEMLARIEELFRVQQRFVADVSHELRSPLTAIRGNLDLLRRGAASDAEAQSQALAAIDSESDRLQRLVDDLLLLARSDEGIKVQKRLVELDTILLDVYRQARIMAGGVKVTLGNEDQAQIMGDPDRLKQLLLNLVDNAIKYTPSGGQVQLSLVRDSDWVRVSVQDTGVGIPAEDLPKVFNRFYRVDKARSRDRGGSGLGLAIVKWIADAHDGRIEVKSQVGKGSTFTLSLPLAH